MSILHTLALIAGAAVISLILTPLARNLALKKGWVAQPSERKVHTKPTPELGGTAIYLAILVMVAIQLAGEHFFGWKGFLSDVTVQPLALIGVLGGATIIYATGLIDDLTNLSPGLKLLGQIIAATVVAVCGVRISFIMLPGGTHVRDLGILAIPLTIFFLVAFANIINLIDGIDGLAAGICAIAAVTMLLLARGASQTTAVIFAALVIGSCLGFLRYNFHPASIFMGDEGALLLGFFLGVISMMGVMKTTAAIALAVPLLIVAVPIFDTASAIVRRLRQGEAVQQADREHIHHRLLGRGFSQRKTVLIIYLWSILLGVGAYAVSHTPSAIQLAALIVLLLITALIIWLLGLYDSARHHK
ncbi:MAG: undecaprenyl/decaprenyl-phosphate alpha-N-acetylglucosaminyl 1-phosphate transferase [Coriobacteriia bacterium]|nr:undecaprenyl/decaprenyl-phosphate alpha-N-acetylglucosaminyl 1-phosphate transferase [Coriobacteriia bacterium]